MNEIRWSSNGYRYDKVGRYDEWDKVNDFSIPRFPSSLTTHSLDSNSFGITFRTSRTLNTDCNSLFGHESISLYYT